MTATAKIGERCRDMQDWLLDPPPDFEFQSGVRSVVVVWRFRVSCLEEDSLGDTDGGRMQEHLKYL
jgi:hypothetical protein